MKNFSEKKNIIIPVFLPQLGCPNNCIYCNQKETTAIENIMNPDEALLFIENEIIKLENTGESKKNVEIAFYGSSFTAISEESQNKYLNKIYPLKSSGRIDSIRISTRPDYISEMILHKLKPFERVTIEIGAQSMDDKVLQKINRGHTKADIINAVNIIKRMGFKLGIHLMLNLPYETPEITLFSAEETAKLKPDFVRLHPTLVFEDTILADWFRKGLYKPWNEQTIIDVLIKMLDIFEEKNIPVVRIGLQRVLKNNINWKVIGGFDHPALGEFIESKRFLNKIIIQIEDFISKEKPDSITIFVNPTFYSKLIGYRQENKNKLKTIFPFVKFIFKSDIKIKKGEFTFISDKK